MELLQYLKNSTPRCLKAFNAQKSSSPRAKKLEKMEEFISRQLICSCGNAEFLVEAYKTTETMGFFEKRLIDSFWPPCFVVCPKCQSRELLFDPRKHGWNGELGESCGKVEHGELCLAKQEHDAIYVYYSYQNSDNYEELIEDGVTNPEDYFDTFGVWFGSNEETLFDYECA